MRASAFLVLLATLTACASTATPASMPASDSAVPASSQPTSRAPNSPDQADPITANGVTVTPPGAMMLTPSVEDNRRGSVAAYAMRSAFYTGEIQLIDAASLRTFLATCSREAMCFEGFFYDQGTFDAVLTALNDGAEVEGFDPLKIGERSWLVHESAVAGDAGFLREYATRSGDTLVAFIVYLPDVDDAKRKDVDAFVGTFSVTP